MIASLFCLLVWRKDSVSAATGDADARGVRCSHELGVLFFLHVVRNTKIDRFWLCVEVTNNDDC